jgi:hypothetical protein
MKKKYFYYWKKIHFNYKVSLFLIDIAKYSPFYDKLVIRTEIFQKAKLPNTIPTNSNDFHSSNELFAYHPCSHSWRIIRTGGDVPPRTVGAAG